MKKIILLTLLALMTLCSAEELKVTTLEVMGATMFRVVCINGYKWLQYNGVHGSISQMFQSNIMNGNAQPIQCKN